MQASRAHAEQKFTLNACNRHVDPFRNLACLQVPLEQDVVPD